MAGKDEYIEYLLDLLMPLGPVTARRMFGGHGLYLDGIMFGLVAGEDGLYLKVDAETEADFEAAGAEPFLYSRPGKTVKMSYRQAPDGSLEDRDELLGWAHLAVAASRRAQAKKPPRRKAAAKRRKKT